MKHKKILIASIVAVLILIIPYTASYYKTLADEHQLALKRNAILEYQGEQQYPFPIDVSEYSERPH